MCYPWSGRKWSKFVTDKETGLESIADRLGRRSDVVCIPCKTTDYAARAYRQMIPRVPWVSFRWRPRLNAFFELARVPHVLSGSAPGSPARIYFPIALRAAALRGARGSRILPSGCATCQTRAEMWTGLGYLSPNAFYSEPMDTRPTTLLERVSVNLGSAARLGHLFLVERQTEQTAIVNSSDPTFAAENPRGPLNLPRRHSSRIHKGAMPVAAWRSEYGALGASWAI
jgi:hypothetical protein